MEGSKLSAHRGLIKKDYFDIEKWWNEVVL